MGQTSKFGGRVATWLDLMKILIISIFVASRPVQKWRHGPQRLECRRLTHWWMPKDLTNALFSEIWIWSNIGSDGRKSDFSESFEIDKTLGIRTEASGYIGAVQKRAKDFVETSSGGAWTLSKPQEFRPRLRTNRLFFEVLWSESLKWGRRRSTERVFRLGGWFFWD